jgi:hypothetical protein
VRARAMRRLGPLTGALCLSLVVGVVGAVIGVRHVLGEPGHAAVPAPEGMRGMPPARSDAAMVFDPATGSVVMFGGQLGPLGNDTWTWDGAVWHRHSQPDAPISYGALMAYDPASMRVVLYLDSYAPSCPSAVGCNGHDAQTWTWDGDRWHREAVSTPDGGGALALDPVSAEPVLLAGSVESTARCPLETWVWKGHEWRREVDAAHSPQFGLAHGLVTDPATRHLIYVVTPVAPNFGCGDTSATWQWDAPRWSRLSTAAAAPPGPISIGIDEVNHQVVALTATGETWTRDGQAWTRRHPVHSPGPRGGAAMAYDPEHRRLVLFGGDDQTGLMRAGAKGDTWTWDGSDWTPVRG